MRRHRMIEQACDVMRDHSPAMHKRLEVIADAWQWPTDGSTYYDRQHVNALAKEARKGK